MGGGGSASRFRGQPCSTLVGRRGQAGTSGRPPLRPLCRFGRRHPGYLAVGCRRQPAFGAFRFGRPMEHLVELRCGDCGALFYLCRACYRGHRYCYDGCRRRARGRQVGRANRRYRQSLEGRLGALDRKRRQRAREQARRREVTHQGSGRVRASESVPPTPPTPRSEPEVTEADKERPTDAIPPHAGPTHRPPLRCARCGRLSHWILHRQRRRPGRAVRLGPYVSGTPP